MVPVWTAPSSCPPPAARRDSSQAARARWKSATALKRTPGIRASFMAESVWAPVAMTTSPTRTPGAIPPAVPTRTMRSTPNWLNSSVA